MSHSIEVDQLRFRYRRAANEIIHIPILNMEKGSRNFLYGPSGCGKTTLLGLITGILQPTEGSIRLLGARLVHSSSH